MSTRDRLLTEGMRLFGEQGYSATSIAQIEAAAGLSPGSGSLYKHFRSKEALLTAGLDRLLGKGDDLAEHLVPRPSQGVAEQLAAATTAGLRRLDEDRDLIRLMYRGLDSFPELLARVGDEEISRFHRAVTALFTGLAGQGGGPDGALDWPAIAIVLQGAAAHYWMLTDLFGEHPTGVSEDRYVAAVATLSAAVLANRTASTQEHPE